LSNLVGDDGSIGSSFSRRGLLKGAGLLGAGLLLPGGLVACTSTGQATSASSVSSGKPRRGGRLRTGHAGGGSVETLDPAKSLTLIDEARARQLFDTLTFYSPDMKVVPFLAQRIEPNTDASQFRITLRSGVTFHNNKPLTADDVLYTWRRILDPKTASGGAAALSRVDMKATKKVSDTEIQVVLKEPQVDFPALLTGREQSIVPDGFTDFSKPVGTGPFMFESFSPGRRSLFKRNPHYWQDGPYVDELEMISIPDNTARLNALVAGQVDAIENLSFTDARGYQGSGTIRVLASKSMTCLPFYVQTDVAPFNSPDVRRALRLSVDRESAVKTALSGFGEVGNDLFGKGAAMYDSSIEQRPYDPEQAKALLRKAGAEGLRVTLNTTSGTVGNVESCQAFAEQAKAAGISVEVKNWDVGKFNSDIYNQVPFAQTYWNFPPEIMFPFALAPKAPYNETRFANPQFEKRYAESQRTIDDTKRKVIFDDLQRMLWDDSGYIIWGFIKFTDATSRRVQGLVEHPYFNLGAFQFRTWWLNA
jgi:peptide/nickel transport system substrate-binding protein